MSDCERFAHIAQDKWATVSESLRLIRGNERMSDLLKKICLQKSKILFFNFFSMFYIHFFWKNEQIPHFLLLVSKVSQSLTWLTKNERCERIAQVTHQKRATMSDSLRSLTENERPWANRSGGSPKMSESLVFLSKFFRKKKSHSLRKPMSEFPALIRRTKPDLIILGILRFA